MSGGSLSQEEIDALMNAADDSPADEVPAGTTDEAEAAPVEGTAEAEAAPAEGTPEDVVEEAVESEAVVAEGVDEATAPTDDLTAVERDTVGEVGNICMSSAATALSALVSRPVQITTPRVDLVDEAEVRKEFAGPALVVVIRYTAGLDGRNVFVLSTRDASIVADLMMGGEGASAEEIGELQASAVAEAMNQMMGSAATAMAEMIGERTDISAPEVQVIDLSENVDGPSLGFEGPIVRTSFQLLVGDLIDTTLMQLMQMDFARELVGRLTSTPAAEQAPEGAPQAPQTAPQATQAAPEAPSADGDDRHLHAVPVAVAQPVTFPSLDEMPAMPGGSDISLLLDVPLQVTVELGRTQLRIRNVLELVPGSIIELDKLAGEPVERAGQRQADRPGRGGGHRRGVRRQDHRCRQSGQAPPRHRSGGRVIAPTGSA